MEKENIKKNKKKFKKFEKIILAILILVFLISAGIFSWYLYRDYSANQEFKEISDSKESVAELQERNADIVAWLDIEDTIIDYPVMHTPDNPEYYLYRNFNGEPSSSGTLFMDGNSSISDPTTYNWLIHGHHMRTGTMFAELVKYKEKDYLEEHPEFTFETVDGEKTYQVVAVVETEVFNTDYEGFAYYNYTGITTEAGYNEYVNGLWDTAIHLVGEKPTYPQQLVTLSTCAYHTDEGRFIVVGVEK